MENIKDITEEQFQRIYTNQKVLKGVVYAHGYKYNDGRNSETEGKKIAFGLYPEKYLVTLEQIEKAEYELKKQKQKEILGNTENIIFISMGMSFKTEGDYIGNHRIRASFINNDNKHCFIEVGTSKDNDKMIITHSIINFGNNPIRRKNIYGHYEEIYNDSTEKNNYLGLEIRQLNLNYTFKNLLNIVNKNFNCSFKNIFLSEILSPDDIISRRIKE
jgi:hypothetical protein